jgi:hypothetical protein
LPIEIKIFWHISRGVMITFVCYCTSFY